MQAFPGRIGICSNTSHQIIPDSKGYATWASLVTVETCMTGCPSLCAVGEDVVMRDNIVAVAREDFDGVELSVRSPSFMFEFPFTVLTTLQLHKCCSHTRLRSSHLANVYSTPFHHGQILWRLQPWIRYHPDRCAVMVGVERHVDGRPSQLPRQL